MMTVSLATRKPDGSDFSFCPKPSGPALTTRESRNEKPDSSNRRYRNPPTKE